MKKSLFALAAVTAFAGAAQAQSSVTVYGILDVGFQGVTARSPANVTTNSTGFSGEGAETTSRLGFRGTEDLGGGMSAFFTAEFALNPTQARLSGDANNGLANRQSFVGLAQKGIGRAAIGTQYTPIHMAVGRTDPGQQNNMAGNVIYATNTSQGNGETTTAYTVRLYQSLSLQTERLAGFQINAIYNNGNSSTSTGTEGDNTAYGAGINYTWKKLNIDGAWQTLKNSTFTTGTQQGALLPSAPTASAPGAPVIFGQSIGQTQMYAGAVYDFGILKAYAQYVNSKAVSNLNSNQYVQRTAQQIGVRGNITKTIEAWASGGTGRITAGSGQNIASGAQPTQNFTGYQLGSNYWLSKRTNMYAIYGSTQVSSSSVNASEGRSSYGLGLRHTF
jgi:predicted porin